MNEEIEDMKKRNRDAVVEVVEFMFAEEYNVEDKKLVTIKIKK
jgi:hypothetical protein